MLSKLTLIGIHNYTKGAIWDNLVLPSGIDKDILTNEIMKKCGEFPILYPDPDFLKIQIEMWSKKWLHNFERWNNVYNAEYEALFNLDVTSTIEEHGVNADSGNKNSSNSKTDGRTITGNSSSNGNTSGSSNGTNSNTDTKSKAAYDAVSFQNTEQDVISGSTNLSTSENHSDSENHSTSESYSGSESYSETSSSNGSHDITTTEIRRGNQGITMSQELVLAEINVWKWNIYDQIADVFVSEFCICIYE